MIDRIGDDFAFHKTALSLRQQRQEVLAANIANVDTPNYKARDFDFSQALNKAMGDSLNLPATQLSLTSAQHIPAAAREAHAADLLYRQPFQPSLDGNTVDMDAERMAFADNTLHYQSSLNVLSQRIKTLMAALQQ
ncbi:flagellar basal body rod protein FlgB [Paenalcaligenes niemegkensis]|uniref:flagellar basal body rod protein FlgB n=1 Tax=Paenalcaligenes niemegkensis TaxID=2895469 RepID=UPI001EE8DE30|nr:flagellar basal body rod protein FlgB [Paenalcaligenes niemegkensis]MCQ9615983.1 flagellar basal body rod protein FlgB [Paenalcaligenes niemegkensis]